jgi:hypothetical protein
MNLAALDSVYATHAFDVPYPLASRQRKRLVAGFAAVMGLGY